MANVVELTNISLQQGNSLVLQNVNVAIAPGEFVYIIGKTGSGKSTLLKLLYAEVPPHSGNATVAGFDLTNIAKSKIPYLRRKLGIVFQDFQLLTDRSVKANFEFVLLATDWTNKTDIDRRITEVLALVGLPDKADKYPHQLSGGEQQRIAVARALLNNPDIILADEPTGNLDPETSREVLNLFRQIQNQGKTIIMATHDYTLFESHESRTLFCADGKVVDSNLLN